jgi:hypothetical protein
MHDVRLAGDRARHHCERPDRYRHERCDVPQHGSSSVEYDQGKADRRLPLVARAASALELGRPVLC